MKNTALEKFWSLYDYYVKNDGDPKLMGDLSRLLAEVENKGREKQLFRPEKKWNSILAWQVLRSQEFYFKGDNRFDLLAGEIIAWSPNWDRDVFLTRHGKPEVVSGGVLRPGYSLTHEDRGDKNDVEWDEFTRNKTFADERGLYLPIYEAKTLMMLCDKALVRMRADIVTYLLKEKSILV
ncbi:MAG: hypothetical protein KBB86_02215 [Candidatus Pacebacteria bacterium]|nr:hypothetical protein [Candidatus Paceibacterota bacterium]